jgi:hypothetical protein
MFRSLFNVLLILAVGLSATPPELSFDDVKDGLEANSLVLIDVRNRDEVQTLGKIPTSNNLPRECCHAEKITFGKKGFNFFQEPILRFWNLLLQCQRYT